MHATGERVSHHAGLSFIEIVLALFLFVLTGSGILSSYLSCHHLSEHATNTMRAVSDLDDMMERIRATPFNTLQTNFPSGVANGLGNSYVGIVGGYTLDGEQIVVTYPSQTLVRLEILVTVNWTQRGRARTTQLSTVRTTST